jgi:hypothetical protein
MSGITNPADLRHAANGYHQNSINPDIAGLQAAS